MHASVHFLIALVGLALSRPAGIGAQAPAAAPRFTNPPSLPSTRGYSHVVAVPPGHQLIFVAGQVATDSTGTLVGRNDFRAQARQVFENLRRALEAEGATFADVVKLNIFVLDISHVPILREVRDAYLTRIPRPTSTLVEVRRLVGENMMIEIDAVAAVRPR